MRFLSILPFLGLVSAQATSSSFNDADTGISFQTYKHRSGLEWGVALPTNATSADFIGIIKAPSGVVWGGADLGPRMVGKLLVVAWPNAQKIVSSLRKATRKASPPVYTQPGPSLVPIPKGTKVGADGSWKYTFLCKGCVASTSLGFDTSKDSDTVAIAASSMSPFTPADPASALMFHNLGEGQFRLNLKSARSSQYSTWATEAGA